MGIAGRAQLYFVPRCLSNGCILCSISPLPQWNQGPLSPYLGATAAPSLITRTARTGDCWSPRSSQICEHPMSDKLAKVKEIHWSSRLVSYRQKIGGWTKDKSNLLSIKHTGISLYTKLDRLDSKKWWTLSFLTMWPSTRVGHHISSLLQDEGQFIKIKGVGSLNPGSCWPLKVRNQSQGVTKAGFGGYLHNGATSSGN